MFWWKSRKQKKKEKKLEKIRQNLERAERYRRAAEILGGPDTLYSRDIDRMINVSQGSKRIFDFMPFTRR